MDRKHSSLRDILGNLTIASSTPTDRSNRQEPPGGNIASNDSHFSDTGLRSGAVIREDDEDVSGHSNLLAQLLQDAHHQVKMETIALKKRLVEEKEVALMEAEREYLSKYDRYQSEINSLRNEVRQLQQSGARQAQRFSSLSERAASSSSKSHHLHRSEYSLQKIFRAWQQQTVKTRDTNRLDRIASSFSRKHILERAFQKICLNIQRRKNAKLQSESKFKFDSVTNEMITRYEAEITRLSDDLKDAYLTVQQEQIRRQQLEEDLRRLFLKNMTTMNMEALNLFEHSHSNVQDVLASSIDVQAAANGFTNDESLGGVSFIQQQQQQHQQQQQYQNQVRSSGSTYREQNQQLQQQQQEYEKLVASTFIQSPPIYPPAPTGCSHYSTDDGEEAPRPPLNAATAVPDSPKTAALRNSSTNLLSELYRANLATTNRLAHMHNPREVQHEQRTGPRNNHNHSSSRFY